MGGDEYPRMGRGARQGKLDKQAATRNPELPTQDEASEASQVRQNGCDEQSKIHREAKQGKPRHVRQVGGDEKSRIDTKSGQGNVRQGK